MKICIYFENVINPTMGGTERASENLANLLNSLGHSIVYLARYSSEYSTSFPTQILPSPSDDRTNAKFIEEWTRQEQIDLIINQGGNTDDVTLFNHQRINVDCKIFTCLHFSPYQSFGKNWWRDLRFNGLKNTLRCIKRPYIVGKNRNRLARNYGLAIDYTDKFILLSESFKSDIKRIVGNNINTEKIAVIPNVNLLTIDNHFEKTNHILYVGRLSHDPKRLDRIFKAWKKIEPRHPDYVLDIVGDGPDKSYYQAIVKRLKLQNVVFHGRCNPTPFYKVSKAILLSSTHESFGLTLVEGMCYGCIPIAFNSYPTVSELIHDNVNGFLVKPFKISAYAKAIERIIASPNVNRAMAEASKPIIQPLSPSAVSSIWEKLITQCNTL